VFFNRLGELRDRRFPRCSQQISAVLRLPSSSPRITILLRDEGDEYAAKLKAANVAVDHTCWPGMVHGLASLAGVLDAGKVLIDQTGAALRKAFGSARLLDHNLWPSATRAVS